MSVSVSCVTTPGIQTCSRSPHWDHKPLEVCLRSVFHSYTSAASSAWRFWWSPRVCRWHPILPQTCSIGAMSSDTAGHGNVGMLGWASKACVAMAVGGTTWLLMTSFWYTAALTRYLKTWSCILWVNVNPPHTVRLTPPHTVRLPPPHTIRPFPRPFGRPAERSSLNNVHVDVTILGFGHQRWEGCNGSHP